jgi:hypothetical protein
MLIDFPPRTTHESELEAAMGVLRTVAGAREAVYVSAPITSGKRLSAWLARRDGGAKASGDGGEEEFRREVVRENLEHAKQIVAALRRECAGVLIDPTSLEDLPGWTQDDYRDFWGRVIERMAREVVFLDGWHYSNGCSYEFFVARRAGVATLDESRRPVTHADGARLIAGAIEETRSLGLPAEFLERVLEELNKLPARDAVVPCTK